MALNQDFLGRSYTCDPPFLVGREHIRQFARAIGDANPLYHDIGAAKDAGYPDVLAPPTFLVATIPGRLGLPVDDPAFGLDFTRVVHGEQKFTLLRPIVAGDELVVVVTIASIRAAGRNEILTSAYAFTTTAGEAVATGLCTVVSRGTAPAKEG
jgi:acyl dehydratase